MKLSAPKQITFIIAVLIALLGVLSTFADIPFVSEADNAFWFVVVGFVLLALANMLDGL